MAKQPTFNAKMRMVILHGKEQFLMQRYSELLQESRQSVTDRMIAQAQGLGANAIINIRFSTAAIAAGASEILAYGTAVITD